MELAIEFRGVPLVVTGEYYKGCPECGESGFSLGTPVEPDSFDIDSIQIGVYGQQLYPAGDLFNDLLNSIEDVCLKVINNGI